MVGVVEGELIKEGVDVLVKHVIPGVADQGRMLFSGRRFLILGPPRCGKTSFFNFLEYLILEPENDTAQTIDVDRGEDVTIRIGEQQRLILRVRKPRDVPGLEPIHQMKYIEEYLPHSIVVVLDATRFWGVPEKESSFLWLEQFCAHLNVLLLTKKKVAKKLKAMTIVLNKWDKLPAGNQSDKETLNIYKEYILDVLNENLKNAFYSKGGTNLIDIVPCALVKSPLGDGYAKQLIQSIALNLKKS